MRAYRPELAELMGVFAFVFIGCSAIAASRVPGFHVDSFGVAVAFGFAIMTMVYAFGHISGAHLNPAVTLAFTASGHFPPKRAVTYIVAQVAGATAAGFLLNAIMPENTPIGVTGIAPGFEAAAFVYEVVITAVLMVVILAVATDARTSPAVAGLAIGSVIVVGALAAGGVSGASFNPARSIGPALAAGSFADLWLYLTAPVTGALFGAGVYEFLRKGSLAPGRLEVQPLGVAGPVPVDETPGDEAGDVAVTPDAAGKH